MEDILHLKPSTNSQRNKINCCFFEECTNLKMFQCKPPSNKLKIFAPILVISFIFLIGLFVYFPTVNNDRKSSELIFAQTICRHGDRNIYESYDNDPYGDESYWPGGFAALTDIGKQQHFALGQYLRERYAELIGGDDFSANKIFVHSSDVERVILSAQITLAGLFSHAEQNNRNWSEHIDLPSIPIFRLPKDEDFLLVSEKQCDRFDYEMIKYTNSTEYQTLFEENRSLITKLEEKTGEKLDTLTKISHLYDKFFVQQLRGYPLPEWAEEAMNIDGPFDYLSKLIFQISTQTNETKKLISGFLLKEILDRSINKTQSLLVPDRSLWMYFGHDTTISNMLNSLGLFELHGPPYASCILFELYETDTEDYLQVFYKNSTEKDIPALEIPGCGFKCPLDKWNEVYKNILPSRSFDDECELHDGESIPASGNPESLTH